jgi:hypothetical protein
MKTFFRWGLIVLGVAVLIGIIYNYKFFFHIWPLYPFGGWRFHYFGPRMWPAFPLFGLLILFVAGILISKYFFQALRDSSVPKKEELFFCPFCGKDLRQGRAISEIQAGNVG